MPRISPEARRALAEERRLQILRAAARVFARKGFERATIAGVAREARLAEGSIYNYFKNKDDLLASVPRLMVLPAVRPLAADPAAPPPPPAPVLRMLAHNMVDAIRDNADIMRIVLSALPSMSAPARRLYLEQTPLYALSMLEKFIAAQIEAGVFRPGLDAAITARTFPGMLLAFLLIQEIVSPGRGAQFDYDAIVDHVVSIFLQGTLAAGAGQPRARRAQNRRAQGKRPRRERKGA